MNKYKDALTNMVNNYSNSTADTLYLPAPCETQPYIPPPRVGVQPYFKHSKSVTTQPFTSQIFTPQPCNPQLPHKVEPPAKIWCKEERLIPLVANVSGCEMVREQVEQASANIQIMDQTNSTQNVVSMAANLMRASKTLQQTLESVYLVVREQIDNVECKTKDVMSRLEERINYKLELKRHEQVDLEIEELQIAAGQTIRQFNHIVRSYQGQLDKIAETKFQRFNVNPAAVNKSQQRTRFGVASPIVSSTGGYIKKFKSNQGREAKVSTQPLKIHGIGPQQYDKMLSQQGKLIVLQSSLGSGLTDVCEMSLNGDSAELHLVKQLQYKVSYVFLHEKRLIIDNQVYSQSKLTQYLQFDEPVLGGCGLKNDIMVFGHISYGRISVFVWRSTEYLFVQKLPLIAAGGASRLRTISLLQTAYAAQDEFYCVISQSTLNKVKLKHNDQFDFQSDKWIIKRAHANIVDSITCQELCLYESNLEPATALHVPPCFDINDLPLLLLQREDLVHCEDVMFSGLREALVRQNFKMLGVVAKSSEEGKGFIIVGHESGQGSQQLQMYHVNIESVAISSPRMIDIKRLQ
ncbi:hypothetical protein FGO68_gene7078 [Halteria grandinella]|uniref:Uncharacterized protein n=1 Tax=Halteria grandinella TaxID=5974 RepID=A0A8J8NU88_HALGN|nr:hypothetical protein FGO68_gene7078 [Halteria grandinella]